MMIIEIVWMPSPETLLLEKTIEKAIKKLELECKIIKINDAKKIKEYNIITLPALVIDDHIIFTGRIPAAKEILDILHARKSAAHGCCGWGCCDEEDEDAGECCGGWCCNS